MGPLRSMVLAGALCAAAPAYAETLADWRGFIAEASLRFGVPAIWIEQVMRLESGGKTMRRGRPIRSRVGAIGLMQLMPPTWADMRAAHRLGHDPDNPRDNILAGTAYLRMMYDRFGYPGLFAAYNAGPARYGRHLATGRSLPGETRAYLASIARGVPRRAEQPAINRVNGLFVALASVDRRVESADVTTTHADLFVRLSRR